MSSMLWKRPRLNNRLDATTGPPLSTDAEIREGTAPADQQESFPLYNDKNLTCADCGQEFVFTASEQAFSSQRGFSEPRRCASCRASRKAARNSESGGSSYGGYGASGGDPGRGGLGGGGGGGGGADAPP